MLYNCYIMYKYVEGIRLVEYRQLTMTDASTFDTQLHASEELCSDFLLQNNKKK